LGLSPASIRNVMSDLEEAGFLYAPHTSAGRLPTDRGLRLFVDGLLEFGDLAEEERDAIAARCAASGRSIHDTLAEAGQMLSGLAGAAGLVVAPKTEGRLRHIEFVALGPGRALVVLVMADGQVENRVVEVPPGLPPGALQQAGNYLNARLAGATLEEARARVAEEIAANRTALDALTHQVVEAGIATWTGGGGAGSLILRGQAKLLQNLDEAARVQEIQALFERLEAQETVLRLLELAQRGEGVQIFIGAESGLFDSAGLAMVVAPFRSREAEDQRLLGAIGVIGPTRINYGKVIPVVDYTARVIGRMLG
jgi:heat-inducible transcriptional repressor